MANKKAEAARQEALRRLDEIKNSPDTGPWGQDVESMHSEADDVLCKLLTTLGYEDIVDKWRIIPKWYA